jgi:hypothetical protein
MSECEQCGNADCKMFEKVTHEYEVPIVSPGGHAEVKINAKVHYNCCIHRHSKGPVCALCQKVLDNLALEKLAEVNTTIPVEVEEPKSKSETPFLDSQVKSPKVSDDKKALIEQAKLLLTEGKFDEAQKLLDQAKNL